MKKGTRFNMKKYIIKEILMMGAINANFYEHQIFVNEKIGMIHITVYEDKKHGDWIACRFDNPKIVLASGILGCYQSFLNKFSGKWNWEALSSENQEEFAGRFLTALKQILAAAKSPEFSQ